MRESVPGYLFVAVDARARGRPVSRLRVVRRAEGRLPVVSDHVCRGDRAVPRLRRGHLISHDDIASPRRPAISACFVAQPAGASSSPCCSSPAPASTLAFFPRESAVAAPASRRRRRAGCRRRISARSSSAGMPSQPRVPLVVPADGAKVLIVKFNDFQCPACGQSYLQYKPILAKYEARASRRGQARAEGLSAEPRLQRRRSAQTMHPAACDAAVAVRLARAATSAARRWRSGSTRTSRR